MADAIGQINELRALAQEIVTNLKAEAPEGQVGELYQLKRDGAYQRSYNIQGLVAKRLDADADMTVAEVLNEWFHEGVLSKALRWTQLNQWANKHNVTLTVAKHEIADGDVEAEVGEVWVPKPLKVEPVIQEKGGVL